MSIFRRISFFHLLHLSKPASDRPIYQAIRKRQARRIVELGIGNAQRAARMIQVAGSDEVAAPIEYFGLDWFEDRATPDAPLLTLKAAHRVLRPTGARVRLIPGDPRQSLIQHANELGQIDMLIFSAGIDLAAMPRLWYYVPRMLRDDTAVFVEEAMPQGETTIQLLDDGQLRQLAAASARRAA